MVSVVIPAYNSACFLEEAIRSVFDQTYSNIEIIVVDDGSSDHTSDVLAPYIGRVRYFFQKNRGPAAARNLGIKHADGEFIAFLDADDIWLSEKLEKQIPLFDNSDVGLVYSDTEIFGDPFRFKKHSDFAHFKRGRVYKELLNNNFISTSSVVVRRSVFDVIGVFDEDISLLAVEDYFLWLKIAARYKIEFVPDTLTRYRVHAHQISGGIAEGYNKLSCLYAKIGNQDGYSLQVLKKYIENRAKFFIARLSR